MTAELTLSELLGRNLSMRWYEAIALVRGVVAFLLDHQRGDRLALPDLHQIELLADGSVVVTGGAPANEPVRRLGQLLQATLSDSDVPVQLRLVVSQATAPTPLYASITEFDQALAYFERPDRGSLLKALFEKAAASGPAAANVVLALDDVAPLGDPAPDTPLPRWPRRTVRRWTGIAAGLVVVLAVSGGAVLYLGQAHWRFGNRTVSGTTLEAADALGSAVMAGVSAVSERVGTGRLVSRKTAAAESPPSELPLASRVRTRRAVRVPVPADPVMAPAFGVPPRAMLIFDPDELDGPGPGAAIGGTSTLEPATAATLDSVIYTSASEDVSPPVDIRPRLPRQPGSAGIEKLSRIELIVARDGTVESAKLLDDRSDVQGGMFLSAAKSWLYRPAMKDGVAVRFRKLILVCFE